MVTATTIADARRHVEAARRARRSIGFVPTMGALHAGHTSLIRAARDRCGFVVVSIFVNPTQFAPGEDFEQYPRTWEADLRECEACGTDLVFAPGIDEMYGRGSLTTVTVRELTAPLCGRFRPGHFDGVTTVVAKLFNIVTPDVAFFGEKDYQQLAVIRRMVLDLDLAIEIVACPTVREPDGLAVSSRNRYLTPDQRRQAVCLYEAMREACTAVARGQTDADALRDIVRQRVLDAGPAEIDYIGLVDPLTLQEVASVDHPVRICLAARIGNCRLIDNMGVDAGGPAG